MALNARELELIIIARDHASSTIARVGGALTILGGGITALGARWAQELGQMTTEAIMFSNDAALAFTQMFDQSGASVEEMNRMLTRVGRRTARPIEELGDAAFDVFSSLDVNMSEAEKILIQVGQAAVAGQTNMRAAMVPTIGMMNAFKLEASDIDRILDVQFETVRRGILSYEEFTANIGKIIPAAVAVGQNMESMGASYAFLTRQGVNASMASTSVARAMELIARPKSVANLEEFGITVRNQQGEFLQMADIVAQLGQRFEGMTAPERKKAFEDIFGTARIQARRFFDVAIPNWREFLDLQDTFVNSEDAMSSAYDVMIEEPATKLQLLQNRWELLRKEIGDRFIPILEEKIIPLVDRVLDMWETLTEEQKDNVARWLALGSVATTVLGILTTFMGLVTLAVGIWKAFGAGIGVVLAGASKLLLPLGLAVAAALLLWQNWDKVVSLWENDVLPVLEDIWAFLEPLVNELIRLVQEEAISFWEKLVGHWETLKGIAESLWENLNLEEGLRRWEEAWDMMAPIVEQAFRTVGAFISRAGEILGGIIQGIVDFFVAIWDTFGGDITRIAQILWDNLPGIFQGGLNMILGILTFFEGLFNGDWEKLWDGVKLYFKGSIMQWWAIFSIAWGILETVARAAYREFERRIWQPFLDEVKTRWQRLWDNIHFILENTWLGRIIVSAARLFAIFFDIFTTMLGLSLAMWKLIWRTVSAFFSEIWGRLTGNATSTWNGIHTIASSKWTLIALAIINPILAAVILALVKFDELRRGLGRAWDGIKTAAKTAWLIFKGLVLNPVNAVMTGIATFVSDVTTKLSDLWGTAKEYAGKIRDALSRIDPRTWFSPPLTATVAAGMAELSNVVTGELINIERDTQDRVSRIRGEIRNLARERESLGRTAAVRGGHGSVTNNNIDIHTQARSATQIRNELNWGLKLS